MHDAYDEREIGVTSADSMQRDFTARGSASYSELQKELEQRLGPLDWERWKYGFEYKEGAGNTVSVHLYDDAIDATGLQELLDFHVSEAGVAARARALEEWELATQPACPKCGSHRWQHGHDNDGEDARQFSVFAAVLLAIAGSMYVFGVPWSLLPAGLALFVIFQGALKWFDYATRRCKNCRRLVIDWFNKPPTRPG